MIVPIFYDLLLLSVFAIGGIGLLIRNTYFFDLPLGISALILAIWNSYLIGKKRATGGKLLRFTR